MAWIYLLLAGMLEVLWSYSMKLSEGFTKIGPSIVTVVAMIFSFGLLALSMRTLPLSVAYVMWTGIGAVGAFIVGTFILNETISPLKIVAFFLVVLGLVLMKVASK